uniref:Cytochrome c oxidase subunit 2 n=1 Tax=Camaena poyuensis TaxID=1708535 RepID=A0A1S5PLW8_9EUPU|nr:cytochrome c oxidase subunit II [Camaena poyuensis]
MSHWGQLNLMDPGSTMQAEMLLFHDHALMIILGIFTLVGVIGMLLLISRFTTRRVHEAQTLEILWTILPVFLLLTLAFPSLRLLYLIDEQPTTTTNCIKAIGHQWYWSYELPTFGNVSFDSYMTPTVDLTSGSFRLLEVDNRVVVPVNIDTSVITTSMDVIHAWALPSMGIKMDSVPGRLNVTNINPMVVGVFYGQCSEICGANHAFMPITVEAIPAKVLLDKM